MPNIFLRNNLNIKISKNDDLFFDFQNVNKIHSRKKKFDDIFDIDKFFHQL